MEVALIRIDPNKKDDDGRPIIVASAVVDTSLKVANQTKPDRDDLLALSRAKFFRTFPGHRFPTSILCRDDVLNEWKCNIYSIKTNVLASDSEKAQFTVLTSKEIKKSLKTLAKKHNKTLSKFVEQIIVNWINQVSGNAIMNIQITDSQSFAYCVGNVARLERELTGKFDPDKYLIGNPKEKIKAVKTYAKTELNDKEFHDTFDALKGINIDQSIPPENYGFFMAGFYGSNLNDLLV